MTLASKPPGAAMRPNATACPVGDAMWAPEPPVGYSASPPSVGLPRLYCGVASVPGRELRLVEALDSVLQQTYLPEAIVVTLATEYSRFPEPFDRAALSKYEAGGRVRVVEMADAGPISKLLGVLSFVEESGGEGWIVIMDDDLVYRPPTLGAIAARISSDEGLGWAYGRPVPSLAAVYTWHKYMLHDLPVPQGADTIAVHSSNLGCVRQFHTALVAREPNFFFHDDVLLGFYFYVHGLAVHELDMPPGGKRIYTQTDLWSAGALHSMKGDKSRAALNAQVRRRPAKPSRARAARERRLALLPTTGV